MDILVSSLPSGIDISGTDNYVLDLSFGDSGNTFEIFAPTLKLASGYLVSIDGTEYGGIIDDAIDSLEGGISTTTWGGRTWHGILASKILVPDSDFIRLAGTATDAIQEIIVRADLSRLFESKSDMPPITVNCQLPRFCDAYTALRRLAASAGARLRIERADGKTFIWIERTKDNSAIDSDMLDYKAKTAYHPVNHLVCAGKGELASRTVLHLFADAQGNVSRTQTFFGQDEVSVLYDYNNVEDDELEKEGIKKLKELQSQNDVDVTVHDGLDLYVGDTVIATNQNTGRRTVATIGKKIVKVAAGVMSITYEPTESEIRTGSSGVSFESSGISGGGGITYIAGAGIRIVGNRISATVGEEKIAALETSIDATQRAAVDAQSKALEARRIGNAALESAHDRVETVLAHGPLKAIRDDSKVELSLVPTGVTAGIYGQTEELTAGAGSRFLIPTIQVDALGRVTSIAQTAITMPTPQAAGGASSFLAAHPVGSIFEATNSTSPSQYGGVWRRLPSLDGFKWERTT